MLDLQSGVIAGDEFDDALLAHVHPAGRENPVPKGRYNLVVVGGGTAGLVTAVAGASLGAKTALVERAFMGGDCLNFGCVPSKALLRSAAAVREVREAAAAGVGAGEPEVDFAAVMARVRKIRAGIAPHDSVARLASLGIDVYLGQARFTGRDALEVGGRALAFRKAVVASGARAALPPIPGLDAVPHYTNETVFTLRARPRRLVVLGAGPIGCELGQAFARLGSEVVVVTNAEQILFGDEAAAVVRARMEREGVRFVTDADVRTAARDGDGVVLHVTTGAGDEIVRGDALLVAAGRRPNVEGLGLEAAGVAHGPGGILVDERLCTANPRIYAAGDVCSAHKFTHAADAMARIVVQNALFRGRKSAAGLVIPAVTYTDPEVARVGIGDAEAAALGDRVVTLTVPFTGVDRAVLEDKTEGFARAHVDRKSGRILGAVIVGREAGDLLAEITLAMTAGLSIAKIGEAVHPYPTRGEAVRKLADAYNRLRLTPRVAAAFKRWFELTR